MKTSTSSKIVGLHQGEHECPAVWRHDELQRLIALYAACSAKCGARSWDTGTSEQGDPQFYVSGTAPELECLLCVSRLGRLYVLEDGNGKVLMEDTSLKRIAEGAPIALATRRRSALSARLLCALCAARVTIEQKIEPFLAESSEQLTHYAPGLAALI
jgi:hypothetical protein